LRGQRAGGIGKKQKKNEGSGWGGNKKPKELPEQGKKRRVKKVGLSGGKGFFHWGLVFGRGKKKKTEGGEWAGGGECNQRGKTNKKNKKSNEKKKQMTGGGGKKDQS